MSLFHILTGQLSPKQLASLAGQVAQRCQFQVRGRIRHRAASMRINEACGYVRARSGDVIRDEVDRILATLRPQKQAIRNELVALSTEALVSSVIRDLTCLPVQVRTVRRAA